MASSSYLGWIAVYDGTPEGRQQTVVAYRTATPGLIAHRDSAEAEGIHVDLDTWAITHQRSGRLVAGGFPTLRAALAFAEEIGTLTNWDRPRSRFLRMPGLRRRLPAIALHHRLSRAS